MARKSRKQNNQRVLPSRSSDIVQVAGYIRLSIEDRTQKGNSVETQKQIILSYIKENPNFRLYDTYIDLGVSGTTFERPEFQRLLRDAESGKVNCIIVKDLSRLGRNVIDTGYYAERLFPQLGVRLISINDNFDTESNGDSISLPLINLLNEAYALDISRKTKSQARQAMKNGIYVGGRPPYGYQRSPDNRHQLVVDKTAADVVKQIFNWVSEGVCVDEITRKLNQSGILSPGAYRNILANRNDTEHDNNGLWYSRTVERILSNEIYLGHLVQGKTKVVEFRRQLAKPDEWVRIENAHEAVVPPELFEAVQSKKQTAYKKTEKTIKSYSPNLFKGKIYCANCGRPMERTKGRSFYQFRCITRRIKPDLCSGCSISEEAVKKALLAQLIELRDTLTDLLNNSPYEADILPEFQWTEMELSHVQRITRSLYESLINGVLNETEYLDLKGSYQGKINNLTQRMDILKQKMNDERESRAEAQTSIRMLNELVETEVLTRECIDRFIDKIEVSLDKKIYCKILLFA